MAKEDFDFKALAALSLTNYAKKYLKETELTPSKVKSGLVFTKFTLGSKNTGVFIPFKEKAGAKEAFELWKSKYKKALNKSGNKIAVVYVPSGLKDGVLQLTVTAQGELKVGSEKDIYEAIKDLFSDDKITLKVGDYDGSTSETGATPVTETTPEEVQETNVKVDPKVLTEDYKKLLGKFQEVQKADHDLNDAKLLFKQITAWKNNFTKLAPSVQEKLVKYNQSCEDTLQEVKKIIKVDQNIGEEVSKVTQIVMDYISMDDEKSSSAVKLKNEAEEILTKIQKYCKFVNAKKLTAKCNQLQEILAS